MKIVNNVAKFVQEKGTLSAAAITVSVVCVASGEAALRVAGVEKLDYLKVVRAPFLGSCFIWTPIVFCCDIPAKPGQTSVADAVTRPLLWAGVAAVGMGIERLMMRSPTEQVSHVLLAAAVGGLMDLAVTRWSSRSQEVPRRTASREQVRRPSPQTAPPMDELWMRSFEEPLAREDRIALDPPPPYVR